MSRKKVLFFMDCLDIGGAEKALVSILQSLDYSEIDCTLLLISKSGGFVEEINKIKGLKVRWIIKPSSNRIGSFLNAVMIKLIYRLLPAGIVGSYLCHGYDVVVAFCEGYLTKWVGAASSSARKIAWVHTDMMLNDWPVETGVFRGQEEEIATYKKFDEIVAVSQIVADGFAEKFQCKAPTVIYNIIDKDILTKSQAFAPENIDAGITLVSVGRLEYVKGYDILIDVMNLLVNHHNLDVNLCIVGDGSERNHILQMIEKYNLKNRVRLAGSQKNPYPYIGAADIYVCPSRCEGFNIAILEAMTLGKPIIACNSAGPEELLDGGKYGVLCEGNPEVLANEIARLIDAPGRLMRLKALSLKRAEDFAAGVQMKAIKRLLEI